MNGYVSVDNIFRSPESVKTEIVELMCQFAHATVRKCELEDMDVRPEQNGLKCSFIERIDDEIDYFAHRIETLENLLC